MVHFGGPVLPSVALSPREGDLERKDSHDGFCLGRLPRSSDIGRVEMD